MGDGIQPGPSQRRPDDTFVKGNIFKAFVTMQRPSGQHLFLIISGGAFNVFAVAAGLHGAFGLAWLFAIAGAIWLIALQTVFYHQLLRNGFLLGTGAGLFCVGAFLFNFVLAAAGVTALLGADGLGEGWFRQSVRPALTAINETAADTSNFAAQMNLVALHSEEKRSQEVDKGGTCVASLPGPGPISRLREDDAANFESARKTVTAVADKARALSRKIDGDIANYSAARHAQIVDAIALAMQDADALARDPGLRAARAMITTRLAQVSSGRPDRLNPALLVRCPLDLKLADVLNQALAIPEPKPVPTFSAPPAPTEQASVHGLARALLERLQGVASDLSGWAFAFTIAWIPDAIFAYGLALHYRAAAKLRPVPKILEPQAALFGIEGVDAHDRLARAMIDPTVVRLQQEHLLEVGWFFRTDWLVIDAADAGRCLWARKLVENGHGYVGRLKFGDQLPQGASGIAAEKLYRMFALKSGVWDRLENEAIRQALQTFDTDPPTPPHADAQPPANDTEEAA